MEEKLVTLAILTYSKAQILKNVLDSARHIFGREDTYPGE